MLNSKFVNIETEYGPIKGCEKESVLGRKYFNFQKIPYMMPPVGKLRFRDPQAPDNWTESLDCTTEGSPFCNVNFMNNQYEGELDAMFINVYTNSIKPTKPYPVMVWVSTFNYIRIDNKNLIDSFEIIRSTAAEFSRVMQKDVVLVTFQYRIGAFGFLSLDDPSLGIPGNAQFRDHIFALKWIQRNIEKFGGDPKNVTLFGESWGGGSTNYHMISKKSKDLFHRGILMSGTALNAIYSLLPRRQWALRLCLQLGYSGPTEEKYLLEFLENADPKEIVLASPKILTPEEMSEDNIIAPFGPTIEPYDKGNAFITDDIVKMAKNCWGNKIDIILSATSNECSMIEMMAGVETELKKVINISRYIPLELGLRVDDEKRVEYGKWLQKNYYGMLKPTKNNLEGVMHLMNDNAIWHPISRIVRSRENSGAGGKSFVFRFDIDSENNLLAEKFHVNKKYREPTHGDDCFYIFKSTLGPTPPIDSPGFKGIRLMLSLFTEFATHGNPVVSELGEGVDWKPATFEEPLKGINIDENRCEVMVLPETERVKVFDEIFIDQNKDLY